MLNSKTNNKQHKSIYSKIILVILLVFTLFTVSCFEHKHYYVDGVCECGEKQKLRYSINYSLNGGTLDNPVESFNSSKDVVLQTPVKEGYEFLGWYELKDQNKVRVETLENRNYNLIAEWKKLNDDDIYNQLSYLSFKNYRIDFSENLKKLGTYSYSENIISSERIVNSNKDESKSINITDYIVKENNVCYLYKVNLNNEDEITYEKYVDSDLEYLDKLNTLGLLNLECLSKYTYTKENNKYYLNEKDEVEILSNNPVINSLSIEIKNNSISNITITINDLDNTESNDENKYLTLTYDFYDYNNVNITVEDIDKAIYGEQQTITSKFVDTNLLALDGPSYNASKPVKSYSASKGLQFLQKSGLVTLKSNVKYYNVSKIKILCTTNADLGMKVEAKVDNTNLISNGGATFEVPKGKLDNMTEVVFNVTDLLTGNITIDLIPNDEEKSMYILQIEVICEKVDIDKSIYMPNQNYNENTHSNKRLQDYLNQENDAIGLPSIGTYNVLVIPVQFKFGSKYKESHLDNLDMAFNGTSEETGYESVKTYYQKSSYGKLNMTFDIVEPYTTKSNANYYNNYMKEVEWDNGEVTYQYGEEAILLEALAYYENILDLSKYDYNKDKVIDGVYLIYNHSIDYYDEDSMFWAFTSWYTAPSETNKTFDNLDAYYYMFAGYDFILEDVKGGEYVKGEIEGLIINATTYIHETGHMLGLDDYYDYNEEKGSNEGLGGADMMDSNCGDHCSYSKIMLNWITPKIVTTTQTINIKSMSEAGDVILVPLDYNGTYMCEYLLIDLYTSNGLNEMSHKQNYLYGEKEYGVRIYHVSSSIENAYSDEYFSITKYNNSVTEIPLIKLIEADGNNNFESGRGYTDEKDLWTENTKLSDKFKNYMRNDGKIINFDIIINSLSDKDASITIDFIDLE